MELRIVRVFKRKAHLFLSHVPDEADSFQWLALMQHHGAPTRLLDFTWSPNVAAFLALEAAVSDAATWALFPPRVTDRRTRTTRASQKTYPGEIAPWISGHYERKFLPNKLPIVVIGEPHVMNQRLTAQSGAFVVSCVLDVPIDRLLACDKDRDGVFKLVLKTEKLRRDALRALYAMNITTATLFPDVGGLARSLAFELEWHWGFDPVTGERYRGFNS
jgi:hypothetical protein